MAISPALVNPQRPGRVDVTRNLGPTRSSSGEYGTSALRHSAVVDRSLLGTLKFRSYYEAQRVRSDYLTMINASLIQVLALAFSAFRLVQVLVANDLTAA